MNEVSFISGLICSACVFQNLSLPYQDWVTRGIAMLCAIGAAFCFWAAFR